MKETKIIFTQNSKIKDTLLEKINLEEKNKTESFKIYEGFRELYKNEENVVLVYFSNFKEALNYVKQNYDIFKIIIAGIGNKTGNIDFKSGDVILPNTFISKAKEDPIFVEYAVGENYDLTKFGLILSGLCISGESEAEDIFDIREDNMYGILEEIKKADLLNKSASILGINLEEDDDVINNVYNVIELVL